LPVGICVGNGTDAITSNIFFRQEYYCASVSPIP
jgi:hypothetical protein